MNQKIIKTENVVPKFCTVLHVKVYVQEIKYSINQFICIYTPKEIHMNLV